MIPADLGAALATALAALVADGELPPAAAACRPAGTWRPARAPAGGPAYATSLPFELARLAGQPPAAVAARLAPLLAAAEGVAAAEPTGAGYLTITVTPAALAAVAPRTSHAGAACARSDALAGQTCPAPPLPDLTTGLTWHDAWHAQAAALTGRLALAAGATPLPEKKSPSDFERQSSADPRRESAPPGPVPGARPARRADAVPGGPAGPVRAARDPAVAGLPARAGPARREATGAMAPGADGADVAPGAPAGKAPAGKARPGVTVAEAADWLGADAVAFWLARIPRQRAGALGGDGPVTADGSLVFPEFSEQPGMLAALGTVRLARDEAAAAARRAGELGLRRGGAPRAGELAGAAEVAVLGRLSWLGERAAGAARRGEPWELPRYLELLAADWARCRESCPALPFGGAAAPRDADGISARLWLADAVRAALAAGLELITGRR